MTNDLFWLVILLGLASIPVAIAVVVVLARADFPRIGLALVVGLLSVVPGYGMGVDYFCLAEHAGNLCGLAAVFGTAPLGFGIGSVIAAALGRVWLRHRKQDAPLP